MDELGLGKIIGKRRREKGITQDELAAFIGVSKASVSKWETGQSYPDITFLPQLATYFNMTIDELMGYSPQMTKEGIRKLYHRLAEDFASKPFEAVMDECDSIIKKYFSCFPLLLQMAVLLANHHMLAEKDPRKQEVLDQAIKLCEHTRLESGDITSSKEATTYESMFYLMKNEPQPVLELLGESAILYSPDSELIATAFQILGQNEKANEIKQINIFQHLMALMNGIPSLMILNADNMEKFEMILDRSLIIAEVFEMEKLNPNPLMQIYYNAAYIYCMRNDISKALDMLEKYTDLGGTLFPIQFSWG